MRKAIKFTLLIFWYLISHLQSNGQTFKLKSYILPDFGEIKIPDFLDTLSQQTAKKIIVEKWLDNLSTTEIETIENTFHVNFTKALLAGYDSSSILFLPTNTIAILLSLNESTKNKNDTLFESAISEIGIPHIKIQQKKFKSHSSDLKKMFDDSSRLKKYTNTFIEAYTKLIYLVSEDARVINTSSKYFSLKEKFPIINFSFSFSIIQGGKATQYYKDIYSIYKDYSHYLFAFEYKALDKNSWKEFEKTLFSTVILY
jgi:hypothetical protein